MWPPEPWAPKPLSFGGLIRVLEILEDLFEDTDSQWEAIKRLDERTIVELLSMITRQPMAAVIKGWEFPLALKAAVGFWASPERQWLASPPEEHIEEEPEEAFGWVTSIIERLSHGRGWSIGYILDLPFLAVLKLLERLDERAWDEGNRMITDVERGVGRAITSALGKGNVLPALQSYRDMKRQAKETEQIRKQGRRFFEAARGEQ